ncbi:MAG: hypothetical protein ACLUEU_09845 [Oscillospiraceae bacterium]
MYTVPSPRFGYRENRGIGMASCGEVEIDLCLLAHKPDQSTPYCLSFLPPGTDRFALRFSRQTKARKPQVSIRIIKRAGDILPLQEQVSTCRTSKLT